ncbi:MAG: inner membrane protein YiaA [Alysiella sp.]|uniref:inner membrane protein YiaA n=1 Tax=Alysiella sp. TaxID=1872483 RepID=UPI0026DAE490|nr:inner membrane protein YiaA [Alysiella sp.]MDO4433903.1 inner membrane protein YiaA [Alysiella sp.]
MKQSDFYQQLNELKPTSSFTGAAWSVLVIGVVSFLVGIVRVDTLALSEKGFYVAVLALGLYAAISLQKTVRDKAEGLPVSQMYWTISWVALALSIFLLIIGLYNSELQLNEKGFYGLAFTQSLFAIIVIQKNSRDVQRINEVLAHLSGRLHTDDE